MQASRTNLILPGLVFILLVVTIIGLTWFNFQFSKTNPGGNDFLVHWVGARALLIDGVSPYSDPVALQIQTIAYGRAAQPGEHELRVAYPLYSALVFAPFALIPDYTLARALWMTALEAALVALAFLSLRLAGWRPGFWLLPFYLLFALLWYHALRGVVNGNAVILVALLLAGALLALKNGKDELAGVLLAIATIKPQVVALVIPFVFLWALSHRRWPVVFWFAVAMIFLTGGAMLFVPDWPLQNLREVLRYPGYNPPGTPGAAFSEWWPALGTRLGWGLTVALAVLLLVEWVKARQEDFRCFLWVACLTLVATQWIGIQTDPGNFVVLFLPVVLVFAAWERRYGIRGRPMILASMALVFFGLWGIFLATVDMEAGAQQHPVMFFPLPAFLLLGLYWVRWWVIKPSRLMVESLKPGEE